MNFMFIRYLVHCEKGGAKQASQFSGKAHSLHNHYAPVCRPFSVRTTGGKDFDENSNDDS